MRQWWKRIPSFVVQTWLDRDQLFELSLNWVVQVWRWGLAVVKSPTGQFRIIERKSSLTSEISLRRVGIESPRLTIEVIEHVPKVRKSQLLWHNAASNLESVRKSNISFERSPESQLLKHFDQYWPISNLIRQRFGVRKIFLFWQKKNRVLYFS